MSTGLAFRLAVNHAGPLSVVRDPRSGTRGYEERELE